MSAEADLSLLARRWGATAVPFGLRLVKAIKGAGTARKVRETAHVRHS